MDPETNLGEGTIIGERLKGQSELVSELPPARVYENFNVRVGNAGTSSSENVENTIVGFKMGDGWIGSKR